MLYPAPRADRWDPFIATIVLAVLLVFAIALRLA